MRTYVLTTAQRERLNLALQDIRSIPTGLHAIEKQIEAIVEQTKVSSDNRKREREGAPSLHIELQLPQAVHHYFDTAQHAEPGKRMREWATLGINVLTLLAVGVYAVITYYQWSDLRRNFQAEQRAWLSQQFLESPLADGQTYKQKITFTNFGKTPLVNYRGAVVTLMVARDWRADFTYAHGTRIEGRVVVPNSPQTAYSSLIPENVPAGARISPTIVDYSMRTKLAGTEFDLVTYGRIEYDDVFGRRHWLAFCGADTAKAEGTGWWGDCVRYNDIDRN